MVNNLSEAKSSIIGYCQSRVEYILLWEYINFTESECMRDKVLPNDVCPDPTHVNDQVIVIGDWSGRIT